MHMQPYFVGYWAFGWLRDLTAFLPTTLITLLVLTLTYTGTHLRCTHTEFYLVIAQLGALALVHLQAAIDVFDFIAFLRRISKD